MSRSLEFGTQEHPEAVWTKPDEESATSEPNTSTSDDRECVIQSLAQLLSSGRSLSEVLAEAKQLAVTLPTPTAMSGDHPTHTSASAAAALSVKDTGTAALSPLATDSATAELIHRGGQDKR